MRGNAGGAKSVAADRGEDACFSSPAFYHVPCTLPIKPARREHASFAKCRTEKREAFLAFNTGRLDVGVQVLLKLVVAGRSGDGDRADDRLALRGGSI